MNKKIKRDDHTGKQTPQEKITTDDTGENIPQEVRLPDGTIDRPITKK